jgi:hypothetical protein
LVLCSVVGTIVFVATIPRVENIDANGEQARWVVEHLGRGGILAVSLVIYAFAGSTGVGLWRLRSWGRKAFLVASGALVVICVVFGSIATARAHEIDFGAVVNVLVFGWPMYYFNRSKIKTLFAQSE